MRALRVHRRAHERPLARVRNLGQHVAVLEKAELIQIEKGYEGKRPRTWVTLTTAGQTALREEIAHLKQLIHQVEQATEGSGSRTAG